VTEHGPAAGSLPKVGVVLMGAPGSGKGTQAALLRKRFGHVVLSAGEMVRAVSREETPTGRVVARLVASGELLPDQLVIELLRDRLEWLRASGAGFVLDGFPRTIPQLAFLERHFEGRELGIAVELVVEREVLARRLADRGRADDEPAAIERRLDDYELETRPVLAELARRNALLTVDGSGRERAVHAAVVAALRWGAPGVAVAEQTAAGATGATAPVVALNAARSSL
jgi:adenylate kinase